MFSMYLLQGSDLYAILCLKWIVSGMCPLSSMMNSNCLAYRGLSVHLVILYSAFCFIPYWSSYPFISHCNLVELLSNWIMPGPLPGIFSTPIIFSLFSQAFLMRLLLCTTHVSLYIIFSPSLFLWYLVVFLPEQSSLSVEIFHYRQAVLWV